MMKVFVILILTAFLMKCGNAKTASASTKHVEIDTGNLDSTKSARDILPIAKRQKRSTSGVIHAVDMSYSLRQKVLRYARWVVENRSTRNYAKEMKRIMDTYHHGGYNCISGTSFSISISYNRGYYIFFQMEGYYFAVYRKR
ncbi:uncharacterized protein LOC134723189 [Mytilus trossulus]|uniref:uncharacterized protein LOC134723189 n=1 Tax=Mytilus trossulus TaxID=6551 RepID=UPI003004291E